MLNFLFFFFFRRLSEYNFVSQESATMCISLVLADGNLGKKSSVLRMQLSQQSIHQEALLFPKGNRKGYETSE